MSGKIPPKNRTKGVDFCGVGEYYYIIRSDLNCYMRSSNFNHGYGLTIFSLHPSCRGGDHYLADKYDRFYIIKGNQYRRVSNLNTDDDGSRVFDLHPSCQGGDHYLSAWDNFYIIYQNQGAFRKTSDLSSNYDQEFPLHPECRNGLYYFGTADYYYCVKPVDEWGSQYARVINMTSNKDTVMFAFHPSVINFLPGGFGVTKGPAYGEWVCIKTISNDSQTSVTWQKKVTKKIGYEKEKMSRVERDWKVDFNVSTETGGLTALLAQSQFSMSTEFGGTNANTEREKWSEATEIEETMTLTLQPHGRIYIWAYRFGFGREPVLHCRDMRIMATSNPPTDVPLPPASN